MRSLLTERDLRIVLILEILISTEWVSLTTLSEYLTCSEKTIRNDLGLISTEHEEVIIESSAQSGYHLVRDDSFPIENTIDQIINNTLIFQLLKLLLEDSTLKLTELESLLFVSSNSIRNTVKDFNKKMKNENIHIHSRPFRIEGDEIKITSLYFVRLHQSYFSRGSLDDEIFHFLDEFILLLFKENPKLYRCFKDDHHALNILLYIRIFREKYGHSSPLYQSQTHDYELLKDKETVKMFYKIFGIPLNNDLISRIIHFILNEATSPNYLQMIYQFDSTNEYRTINNSLERVMNQVAFHLKHDPFTTEDIKTIIQPTNCSTVCDNFDYRLHLALLQFLKYEQSLIFKELNDYKHMTFFENYVLIELAYLLQKNCPSLLKNLAEVTKKMAIAVLLITNQDDMVLYKHYFDYHFSSLMTFDYIHTYSDQSNYKLLITNTYDYTSSKTPVLNIAGLPNGDLNENILEYYNRYRLDSYLNFQQLDDD